MTTRRSDKQILNEADNVVKGAFSTGSVRTSFINVDNLDAADDDSSTSGTGAAGAGGPLIDLSAFGLTGTAEFLLAEAIRKGEAKFGAVPFTKDPNQIKQKAGAGNEGPKRHPLLSESQRFDGADPKLNPVITDNPEAREQVANELRLQAQLQNRNESVLSSLPTNRPV